MTTATAAEKPVIAAIDFSAADLIDRAKARTGLSDFGGMEFADTLDRIINALKTEAELSPRGREGVETRYLRLLVNRLRYENDRKLYPEIDAQVLQPPVMVSSLPRCGSTKMHRLLAESGDFQSMIFWQGYNVAPFPDAKPGEQDPRIQSAIDFVNWRHGANPNEKAGHAIEVFEPEEEAYLMEHEPITNWPAAYYHLPKLFEWMLQQPRHRVYRYLAGLLKYLQWQHYSADPKPWILKNPSNIGYEAEMTEALPGIRFIMLHRDPVEAISSLASFVSTTRGINSAHPARREDVLDWALTDFGHAMERHVAWRKANPDAPVIDVSYADIINRDEQEVQRVYDFLGRPLTPSAKAGMDKWRAVNAQGKYGKHEYSASPEEVARIKQRFAGYIDRFGDLL